MLFVNFAHRLARRHSVAVNYTSGDRATWRRVGGERKTRHQKLFKSGESRTTAISTQTARGTMSSVVQWSCFLKLAVLLFCVGSADVRASGTAAVIGSRPYDWSCATPADGPATCLFKGLLKNTLLYVARRRHGHDTAAVAGSSLQSKGIEDYLFDQIQNIFGMFSIGFELPAEVTIPWTMLRSSLFNGKSCNNGKSEISKTKYNCEAPCRNLN